ncbi:TetR/AcrR family transcriptional regulator [Nocardia jejuensis]|uniref:TetR/AcrR family transcriptional regulator n=1 Tax=Nocardia jejuensis TaxID=328049 RepID=UPI00082AFEF8|nr:TetR/AcrR family transcriptional regulator [Nocardia jejuensis]
MTRAESQAQTREDLLDAAERLFFAQGCHATSITTIAAEAGRTIGALYSNFENKEALCLEVIQRALARELAKLTPALMAAPEGDRERLEVLSNWWARSSTNTELLTLGAEYLTTIFRHGQQHETTAPVLRRVIASGRILLEEFVPRDIPLSGTRVEAAVRAIVATGAGLSIGSASGIITAEESARLLSDTITLWIEGLRASIPHSENPVR